MEASHVQTFTPIAALMLDHPGRRFLPAGHRPADRRVLATPTLRRSVTPPSSRGGRSRPACVSVCDVRGGGARVHTGAVIAAEIMTSWALV